MSKRKAENDHQKPKKVRIGSTTTHEIPANTAQIDDSEDLEEARKRRGAINYNEYNSDEEVIDLLDSDLDSDVGGAENAKDEDEDMFGGGVSKPKSLTRKDIEGQEWAPVNGLETDSEAKIMPFNMDQEMDEGEFDGTGHYIQNKRDVLGIHDVWLKDITKLEMEKAKLAQIANSAVNNIAEEHVDVGQLWKTIVTLMQPRETILKTLARLGCTKGPKMTFKQKKLAAKNAMLDVLFTLFRTKMRSSESMSLEA